jgi:putative transposase
MGQLVQVFAYTGRNIPAHLRYIELNPVRATMVEDPAHYRWTSYRANALGQTSPLLVPHSVYLPLGGTDKARQAAYRH